MITPVPRVESSVEREFQRGGNEDGRSGRILEIGRRDRQLRRCLMVATWRGFRIFLIRVATSSSPLLSGAYNEILRRKIQASSQSVKRTIDC